VRALAIVFWKGFFMEIFKDTRFDFLGRKWWFIVPSLVLTLAGLASLALKGGPRYSIDFRGGAVMDVRWDSAPPIERIRAAVSSRLSGVSIVAAHDLNGSHEVLISVQLPAQGICRSCAKLWSRRCRQSVRGFRFAALR
jgi:preprotein translocase subunit SecF